MKDYINACVLSLAFILDIASFSVYPFVKLFIMRYLHSALSKIKVANSSTLKDNSLTEIYWEEVLSAGSMIKYLQYAQLSYDQYHRIGQVGYAYNRQKPPSPPQTFLQAFYRGKEVVQMKDHWSFQLMRLVNQELTILSRNFFSKSATEIQIVCQWQFNSRQRIRKFSSALLIWIKAKKYIRASNQPSVDDGILILRDHSNCPQLPRSIMHSRGSINLSNDEINQPSSRTLPPTHTYVAQNKNYFL